VLVIPRALPVWRQSPIQAVTKFKFNDQLGSQTHNLLDRKSGTLVVVVVVVNLVVVDVVIVFVVCCPVSVIEAHM